MRTYGAHQRPWSRRPACPSGCATGPWPRSAALAEVEGRLHRRPTEQVHFHEVGGLDAIVDVVGTCAALEVLDVDEVTASPVATGHRHGPQRPRRAAQPGARGRRAAARRRADLRASTSPSSSPRRPAPRCSPRWRRRLRAAAGDDRSTANGFGAGDRELDDRPNVTQVVVGDAARRPAGAGSRSCCSRPTSTTSPARRWPTPIAALLEAGRPRRVGHADRDEEGPARPTPSARSSTRRWWPQVARGPRAARPARSACAGTTLERWPRPAPPTRSRSTATRCG